MLVGDVNQHFHVDLKPTSFSTNTQMMSDLPGGDTDEQKETIVKEVDRITDDVLVISSLP